MQPWPNLGPNHNPIWNLDRGAVINQIEASYVLLLHTDRSNRVRMRVRVRVISGSLTHSHRYKYMSVSVIADIEHSKQKVSSG